MNLVLPDKERVLFRRQLLAVVVALLCTAVIVPGLYSLGWATPHASKLAMKIGGGCEFAPQGFTLFGTEFPFQFTYA